MQVLTPTGYVPVTSLSVGDDVCAFDVDTGAPILNQVEAIELYTPARFTQVYGEGEDIYSVTPETLTFYVINGVYSLFADQSIWRNANEVTHVKFLQVGDTIFNDVDGDVVITSISTEEATEWYRLTISGDHSYIADGITLHNASRFWVGGTGSWSAANTANWASSSGGGTGASVPTSVDDVTFDSSSNATLYTMTISGTANCNNFTMGAPASGAVTWAGGSTLNVFGSISTSGTAGVTRTFTGAIVLSGTGSSTITSNSVTYASAVTISGVGGTYSLADAFTSTGSLTITAGTFDTTGKTTSFSSFLSSGALTKALTLGASVVALTLNGSVVTWSGSNLTFSCGTSAITIQSSSGASTSSMFVTATGTNTLVFYDVHYRLQGSGPTNTGAFTFHNLQVTPGTQFASVPFSSNITVTGTLTGSGTTGGRRVYFVSSAPGTTLTITAAAVSLTDTVFLDVTGAGAASWTGTRVGDGGGNSNITFTAAATKYWVGGTGGSIDAARWALSSGGASAAVNYPLPQDDVVLDGASNATAYTATIGATNILMCTNLTITAPGTSGTVTLAGSATLYIFGNLTLLSGMTRTYNGTIVFGGRSSGKTITMNGVTLGGAVSVNGPGGAWTLQDNFTTTQTFALTAGSWITNTKTVSTAGFSTSALGILNLSGSSWTCTSWVANAAMTLTVDTSSLITSSGAFVGAGLTYNDVTLSANSLSISGANTFRNFTLTGAAITTLTFNASFTVTGTFTLPPSASVSSRYAMVSTVVGTTITATVAAIASLTDVDFADITAAGASAPWSGTRLGDGGGNTSITFGAGVPKYYVGNTANWNGTVWATSSGGVAAANNYPLAQDTVIFDGNSFSANGQTVTMTGGLVPAIDFSAITATGITFSIGASTLTFCGNVVLKSTLTLAGTATSSFNKRGTQSFTSAGLTFPVLITINVAGGTFKPVDNFTTVGNGQLTSGTLDLNGQTFTCLAFNSSTTTSSRTVTDSVGGGKISTTQTSGAASNLAATNLTINRTNPWTLEVGGNSASTRTIATTGSVTLPAVVFTNTTANGQLSVTGTAVTLKSISYTGGTAQSIKFTASSTITIEDANGLPSGTAGNVITLGSLTAASTFTLTKSGGGLVVVAYATISDSIATPSNTWYGGTTSTDGGNNTGWLFTIPPISVGTATLSGVAPTTPESFVLSPPSASRGT